MTTHFDVIAAQYDDSLPRHVQLHYRDKRIAFVKSHVPTGLALDVGCGTGTLAGMLQSTGYRVIGVDLSLGMLKVGRAYRHLRGVVADGSLLPFGDGVFDLTYCVAVLHHIASRAKVAATLAEMVRVTAPGGFVLVWDHNPRNPYWPLLMRRVPQDTGDERLIPQDEIFAGLQHNGVELVTFRQLGLVPDFIPPSLLGLAASIEKIVESLPVARRFCAHNVVLGRRSKKGTQMPSSHDEYGAA